jgi:cell wall assembly regulator SMI1
LLLTNEKRYFVSIEIWTRLQKHWEKFCPHIARGGFNDPATKEQIDAAEAFIGVRFPEDLRQAYLHFNGMQSDTLWDRTVPSFICGRHHWVDLEYLVSAWAGDRSMEASWDKIWTGVRLRTAHHQYKSFFTRHIPSG